MCDKLVPGITADVEDVAVGEEDAVRQPVASHVLPDVFERIELGALRRYRHYGYVRGDDQSMRQVPSRLIDEKHGMSAWADGLGDFRQVQVHRRCVAAGQDERGSFAEGRTDGTENVG